jgi:hypothetical protein
LEELVLIWVYLKKKKNMKSVVNVVIMTTATRITMIIAMRIIMNIVMTTATIIIMATAVSMIMTMAAIMFTAMDVTVAKMEQKLIREKL